MLFDSRLIIPPIFTAGFRYIRHSAPSSVGCGMPTSPVFGDTITLAASDCGLSLRNRISPSSSNQVTPNRLPMAVNASPDGPYQAKSVIVALAGTWSKRPDRQSHIAHKVIDKLLNRNRAIVGTRRYAAQRVNFTGLVA